ncbi:DapH/DapD/GlmU-related protein [Flavobacterium sp. NKUCC04_CG]|uniref:acyltransferase n=1 Tax=Flavobacterium sp. NKUCC04_CG TaxID=2842121 RepID=UPI001C5A5FAD|nr:acyltransferase [Flavobacterium sp. NKUCC04_CG]MBW3517566.1 acyltransferase [Flavobacterium sp. NKUCC04_CG]
MLLTKYYRKGKSLFWTLLTKKRCGSYKGKIKVNQKSFIGSNVHLGNNVHFNGMMISKGGNVYIGDNFHSGPECVIIVQYHNYEGEAIPYDGQYIKKDVTIEDNVWLGQGVMIMGGVTIGEGSIIQAGSVVVSNIPKYSIAGGHPAKVFKQRDIEHYHDLKDKEKFW